MLQSTDLQFVTPEMDQKFVVASIAKSDKKNKIYGEDLYGRLTLYTQAEADLELQLINAYKPYHGESSTLWIAEQLSTLPEETLKKFKMTRFFPLPTECHACIVYLIE